MTTRAQRTRAVFAAHTYRTMYVPGDTDPARWWLRCDCPEGFTTVAARDGHAALMADHNRHLATAMHAAGITEW